MNRPTGPMRQPLRGSILERMILAAILTLIATPTAPAKSWGVTDVGGLVWNNASYSPFGARIEGTGEQVRTTLSAGVKDLLIEMPADGRAWPDTLAALQNSDARFFFTIQSKAPTSEGVDVSPEAYRLTGITGPMDLEAKLPGYKSALVVISETNGQIAKHFKAKIDPAGNLRERIVPPHSGEFVILVYPIGTHPTFVDAWEKFDAHRDRLLAAVKQYGDEPGLRGIFNPAGTVLSFPDANTRFVPTSRRFRMEFEASLKQKYGTQRRLEQAWNISASDFTAVSQIARLVPLWSAKRGVNYLWDPDTDQIYSCNSRSSSVWADIQEELQTTLRRRFINLSRNLQEIAHVPVIQRWAGWNGPYEGNAAGLSGCSVMLEGDGFLEVLDNVARAASTGSRWASAPLIYAEDIKLAASDDRPRLIQTIVEESATMGLSGWFVSPKSAEDLAWIASMNNLGAEARSVVTSRTSVLPFPESARNPAQPMRLGGGTWWLPAPIEGNRIDLGKSFAGYRMRGNEGDQVVLWPSKPLESKKKIKLMLSDPKSVKVRTLDNRPIAFKIQKGIIELDPFDEPLSVLTTEVPVPEIAIAEAMNELNGLVAALPANMQSLTDDIEAFRQATTMLKTNPGGGFQAMRVRLERLRRSLSPFIWIEAEASRNHNFSDIISSPGASNGSALSLETVLTPLEGVFKATYNVSPRFEGVHQIWVAMNGDRRAISSLNVRLLNESFGAQSGKQSVYGADFGWVNFGQVNLGLGSQELSIEVKPPLLSKLSVDAILLSPAGYRPDGVRLNWDFPTAPGRN